MSINFSQIVKNRLDELNMHLSELSQLIGISSQHASNLINGKRRWNETIANKTCEALGLKVSYKKIKGFKKGGIE